MEIIEFAKMTQVPVLRAGEHPSRNAGPIVFTEADVEETLQGSNELATYLRQGHVPPVFADGKTSRKLPSPLNLMHDDILDDTIRERVRGVSHSFAKKDGWIVEDFENVPADVARAIKNEFPLRSVDLIPWKNPETGKEYKHVIVSTAFLNRYTKPAVEGQTDNVQVEFASGSEEDPVIVLYSGTEHTPTQGGHTMPEQQKKEKSVDTPNEQHVSELMQQKDAEIARLKALTDKSTEKITELEAERQSTADAIVELQRRQDEAEVTAFLKEFALKARQDAAGIKYTVAPGFVDLISPVISKTSKTAVIELAEGSQPARDVLESIMEKVVEKAIQGAIVVPISELGRMEHKPGAANGAETIELATNRHLKESPGMTYGEAWAKAADELGTFKKEGN